MKHRVTRIFLPLFCCVLLAFLAACGTGAASNNNPASQPTSSAGQTPTAAGSSAGSTSLTSLTQTMPATQTSCPAPGTARAMVSANLAPGNHNTLVYVVNEYQNSTDATPTAGTLKRYDVTTGTKTVIVGIPHESIESTQVSADGKWMLFTTSKGELRLVRIDGQGLQTLFCAAGQGVATPQWSSDQRHIIFSVNEVGNREAVYLLTVATGNLQTELSISDSGAAGQGVSIGTWLDNNRVYLTNYQLDQPHNKIYILDINHGTNQNLGSLPALVNQTFGDFDSSYNGQQLYVDYGFCGQGGCNPPSKVTVQAATGGAQTTILNEPNYDVITVRMVTANTLLLVINNNQMGGGGNTSHNGLWKINPNGSGLTRLTTDSSQQFSSLNSSTQFPWSNVSRDSGLYAVEISSNSPSLNYTLAYGSLGGGATTSFASIGGATTLSIAGWSTM